MYYLPALAVSAIVTSLKPAKRGRRFLTPVSDQLHTIGLVIALRPHIPTPKHIRGG
jgi:hypothetical protein